MANKTNAFLAFLTGITAGAVLGILFAPDKGANTRDRLSYQLEKYAKKLKELLDDFVEGKNEATSEAKSEGEKVISDAREKAEKLLDDVDELIGQIKKK